MDNHAYWRNLWLWACFSLGTFNSCYYYGESIYTSSFTLCSLPLLFMSYLIWDTYKILFYKQLYRSDLLMHHIACIIIYSYISIYGAWLSGSLIVIAENLSLFNYWLANSSLLRYKLCILLFYRIPFWIIFSGSPFRNIEYADHFYIIVIGPPLFIVYDLFMIKKIIQNPLLFK
jgi:hypothetical protein